MGRHDHGRQRAGVGLANRLVLGGEVHQVLLESLTEVRYGANLEPFRERDRRPECSDDQVLRCERGRGARDIDESHHRIEPGGSGTTRRYGHLVAAIVQDPRLLDDDFGPPAQLRPIQQKSHPHPAEPGGRN
jgi:hypothetical protein